MKKTNIRRALCAALAILTLSAFVPSASALSLSVRSPINLTTTSAADALIPDGEYYISLYNDLSKGMNVQFASKTAGNASIVVDGLNSENNEIFLIRNHGGNVISIHPKHAPTLALNCLYGSGAVKGQNLTLWNYEDNDQASLWRVLQNEDGSFCIMSLASGYVMDLNHANYTVGNNFLLWQKTGESSCQSFYFLPVSTSAVLIPNGTYNITLHDDSKNKCLNIQYASKVIDKAAAVVDTLNGELNETFRVVNRGNGLISIHPLHCENLCLNAQYGLAAVKGQNLILHNYEANDLASLWLPIKNSDGSFSLKSAACSWVIDVNRGDYTDGNRILLWEKTGNNRIQSFFFVTASSQNSNSSTASTANASPIVQRLEAMANGSYGGGAYRTNTQYTGAYYHEQCKGFAKQIFIELFGYNIGSTKSNNYQISINSGNTSLVGSLTSLPSRGTDALRSLFASVRPGDFIQVRRSHGGPHSMIFLSADTNGVTVYECNVNGPNLIEKNWYSYSQFLSKNSDVSVYTAKNYYLH